jgi:predicted GNAT superfamily acetyltransferase
MSETEIEIREAAGAELVAGGDLLAASLRFSERDAIPAWLMQTTAECGGLALGAFRDGVLGGFSYAVPCGEHALFSCGLAVLPEWRGHGVGRRLKLAQRERALRQGRTHIRWTADPLSAAALTLYLPGLGARLTAYSAELYADVRPAPVPADDVTIDWPLLRSHAARSPCDRLAARRPADRVEPRVADEGSLPPALRELHDAPAACVEVPFDHTALADADLLRWRLRVRRSMRRALAGGAVGTGMAVDRAARRCWVLFERAER